MTKKIINEVFIDTDVESKVIFAVYTKDALKKHLKKYDYKIQNSPFDNNNIKRFSEYENEEDALNNAIEYGYWNYGEGDFDIELYDMDSPIELHEIMKRTVHE